MKRFNKYRPIQYVVAIIILITIYCNCHYQNLERNDNDGVCWPHKFLIFTEFYLDKYRNIEYNFFEKERNFL